MKIEMKRANRLIIGLPIGAGLTAGTAAQGQKGWQAPDIGKLPDDKYGQMVRQGMALMEQTYKHLGPEVKDVNKRYAGNNLACVSCHDDVVSAISFDRDSNGRETRGRRHAAAQNACSRRRSCCTSGNGISGGLQLALTGWVFLAVMFATGTITAFIMFRPKTS